MGYLGMQSPFGIAHRGGSQEHLENSPSAFTNAIDLGFKVIETDLQVTADGVLVLLHDPSLARTSSVKQNVSDLTWKQLSNIRLRNGEPIMRLEQLVDIAPSDIRFNLDPKTDATVEPLITFLRSDDSAAARICVGSFSSERLIRIRAAIPHLATSLGSSEIRSLAIASRTRLGRWQQVGAVAVQVPEKAFGLRLVTKQFINFCHDLGMDVHVWTVNSEQDMHRLYDLGVDALITDRPSALKQVLIQRGHWRHQNG